MSRKRESDEKVGSIDELVQLASDPLSGGRPTALRTRFVIAGVPGEMELAAIGACKDPTTQSRGTAVGDGPEGAALIRGERRRRVQKVRQELTQCPDHRGGDGHAPSAWQFAAELIHQTEGIAGGLMGQVQIDHGGGDLLVTEKVLDGMEMSAGLQHVGREAVPERMD